MGEKKQEEDIYMDFPDEYLRQDKQSTTLKLVRFLYGVKQSPTAWWQLMNTSLAELELT